MYKFFLRPKPNKQTHSYTVTRTKGTRIKQFFRFWKRSCIRRLHRNNTNILVTKSVKRVV